MMGNLNNFPGLQLVIYACPIQHNKRSYPSPSKLPILWPFQPNCLTRLKRFPLTVPTKCTMYFKQYLMCVYLFVNITRFDLCSVMLFCCFYWGNRGKPTGKIRFSRLRVRSASLADFACVFSTKTMAVRIFRSGKIANFGGIIFAIVHLFRLGSNGFW
jgi:hypothetical protein